MHASQNTTIHLTHKIRLAPTPAQEEYFRRASGTARFAYNWGLNQWRQMYAAGEKPSQYKVDKDLNAVKREQFPWMYNVSKCAPQNAILNLGRAFDNFFAGRSRYPVFKKKGKAKDSFVANVGANRVKVDGQRVWIPKLGWVKMREALRFAGYAIRITVSRTADHWYAAISVRMPGTVPDRENQADGGLDVGITPLAVESDGTRHENPRALQAEQKKLRRWNRRLARRTRGSSGWQKAKFRLARIHQRIDNIRNDAHHKLSRSVVDKYTRLGVESLHVAGMLKNRRLSRHVSDAALGGLLQKVAYKAAVYGTLLVVADRWYPSSKTCSACGRVNGELTLSDKRWRCPCGTEHDRDHNAAINLKINVGRGTPEHSVCALCPKMESAHTSTPVNMRALAVGNCDSETSMTEAGSAA